MRRSKKRPPVGDHSRRESKSNGREREIAGVYTGHRTCADHGGDELLFLLVRLQGLERAVVADALLEVAFDRRALLLALSAGFAGETGGRYEGNGNK